MSKQMPLHDTASCHAQALSSYRISPAFLCEMSSGLKGQLGSAFGKQWAVWDLEQMTSCTRVNDLSIQLCDLHCHCTVTWLNGSGRELYCTSFSPVNKPQLGSWKDNDHSALCTQALVSAEKFYCLLYGTHVTENEWQSTIQQHSRTWSSYTRLISIPIAKLILPMEGHRTGWFSRNS